jgi:hypothetical protein
LKRKSSINYTIIGTPKQIPEGVSMRVLLDARLVVTAPALSVGISDTIIEQMLVAPSTDTNSSNLYPILSQNGVYAIAAAHHRGDTRGNDWYTDVTCINNAAGILSAMAKTNSLR